MANAAPYIATPLRRLAAGAADFLLCFGVGIFGWGIVASSSDASTFVELALRNRAPANVAR